MKGSRNLILSIILPVYNVEPYLKECLDSIFDNTVISFELIAVNDGSTDNSLKILKEYSLKYENMKVINQKNKGLSVARNIGLNNSNGQFIYFFDSDDILTDKINLLNSIGEINKYDVITFDAVVFEGNQDDGIKDIERYKEPEINSTSTFILNGIKLINYTGSKYLNIIRKRKIYTPVVWRRIYKKSFLVNNNLTFYPGLIPAEDDLHFFQTLFLNPAIIHVKEILLLHRVRKTSIMSNLNQIKSYESFNVILQELFKMRDIDYIQNNNRKNLNWVMNVFFRRIHSQSPNLKEAIRLFRMSKENHVRLSMRTVFKILVNTVRSRKNA